ncbi:MAG: hypothetical protein AB1576_07365 [Bacillota bacterium]
MWFPIGVTSTVNTGIAGAGRDRLGVDELEALRLEDVEGLKEEECAKRMNLAQAPSSAG